MNSIVVFLKFIFANPYSWFFIGLFFFIPDCFHMIRKEPYNNVEESIGAIIAFLAVLWFIAKLKIKGKS